MEPSTLRAPYLSGPSVYLRAPVVGDKEAAAAWLGETFLINAPRAEAMLKEEYRGPRWPRGGLRLVIVRQEGDAIVGGVRVSTHAEFRRCTVELTMAPWEQDADALRAEALRIVVRWLRDEIEAMVVGARLAADQPEAIRAAEETGMIRNGTLREWFVRPGGRVDVLVYEALNPRWAVSDA